MRVLQKASLPLQLLASIGTMMMMRSSILQLLCMVGDVKLQQWEDNMEGAAWDIGNIGIVVWCKEHQSLDSAVEVLLMNAPPVFDKHGIKGETTWHLAEMQKSLLRKGKLLLELHGTALLEINVSWWQNKQGKGERQEQG